ncbi:MAG TPA: GAF domain-containing sensor histidine kinase [Anaerolineae bacterium]|nr:GAF domain-containing sensor histidine kinase [Anaerolineae bacterium]
MTHNPLDQQKSIALILHAIQTANRSLDLDQVLDWIAETMITAIGTPFCGIYLTDAAHGVLVLRVASGALTDAHLNAVRNRRLDPAVDSLVDDVFKRKEPAVCYDAQATPHISRETAEALGVKSIMILPLMVGDQALGATLLSTFENYRTFTPDEIELARGIANALALAIENARLYQETRQRLAESKALQRMTAALLQKIDLEDVGELVCAEARNLTGAHGSAFLLLEDNTWLRVAQRSGAVSFPERIPIDGSNTGWAVRTGEPFLKNDPDQEAVEWHQDQPPTTFLAIPLRVNNIVIGVLDVIDKPAGFTPEDVRIVSLFADQTALSAQHALLDQQVERLAIVEERQRLARELHDSVVQSLYSVTLYADAAALALAAGQSDVTADHLQLLRDTAQDAMRDMRLLIFELHPPDLEQEGLVAALQARLAAVETRASLHTEFLVEGDRRLPFLIEQELYGIAQEALNNVGKHARAKRVTVHLQITDKIVCLEVRDDGVGFDPSNARKTGGVGLRSIEERTAKVGGTLALHSEPGAGTRIKVEIPLPAYRAELGRVPGPIEKPGGATHG